MFYINYEEFKEAISALCDTVVSCFILTMRNLKIQHYTDSGVCQTGFILTMRNLKIRYRGVTI